jgi:dihydroorotase
MVRRDLALARLTGARIHFQHLSTACSVELVRAARTAGIAVTAEATTHHFTLTHASCAGYDPVFKVHPPLRSAADVDGVRAGLADGALDAIATDHAPHAPHQKELPFDQAPPGMLGLETALALALTELDLPIDRVLALLSWQPAAIAGLADLQGGPIEPGRPAHLCIIDPAHEWVVEPAALASRARNTPYAGRRLRGKVRHTLLGGELVVRDGEALR